MRQSRDIEITDGDNTYKFRVTALSALALQRWAARAAVLLAGSGLLDVEAGAGAGVESVVQAIAKNGLRFLGGIDADKGTDLVLELVCKSTTRIDGAGKMQITETELDALFSDMKALLSLEKEVFAVNFGFLALGGPAASPAPDTQKDGTTSRRISRVI